MATVMGIDNAIGWAHWQLRGGLKNTVTTTVGFSGLIVLAIFLTVRMTTPTVGPNPNPYNALWGWRIALLWIETGLLILMAGSRVTAAVRLDITSRMIESHRLMPVSPLSAISGYLWGPTLQAVCLAGAMFIIGMGVTLAGGLEASVWVIPSVIIATFAVFSWILMAFSASITRASGGGAIGLVFVAFVGQGIPVMALPGLIVLLSPLTGKTVFQAQTGMQLTWQMAVSLAAQIYLGTIFYFGAARKYRRTEDPAFGILLAMLLLVGWVAVSAIGTAWWNDFVPFMLERMEMQKFARLIASMLSASLLSLIAVGNAAHDPKAAWRIPLVAILCAIIICSMGLIMRSDLKDPFQAMVYTQIVLASLVVGAGYFLGIITGFIQRRWILLLIWIALSWVAPVLIDVMYWQLQDAGDFSMTWISSFSPAGALGLIWQERRVDLTTGLIFQSACCAGWMIFYYMVHRRRTGIAT